MPGLVLFNRKWLVAGDLLLFPLAIETVLRTAWFVAASYMTWTVYQDYDDCVEKKYVKEYLLLMLVDLALNIPLCGIMTWLSSQGSVLREGRRAYLPSLLYIKIALFSLDLFITIIGIWLGIFSADFCICIPPITTNFIHVTTVCFMVYFVAIIVVIVLTYNSLGSLRFSEGDNNRSVSTKFYKKSRKIWACRLKCLCCCLGINDNNRSIYQDIADFFASFFEVRDTDLIPSDVLTGLVIISKKHASEKKRLKFMDSLYSYSYINPSDSSVPLWMNAENALYFFRYAKYTYGWPLLVSTNPLKLLSTALTRCCGCSNRKANKNSIGTDNCCNCNIAALKKAASSGADIVYASYCTAIYEPAFFVAVDTQMSSVVVGIRGTFSLSDIVTDFDAEKERVDSVQNFFCHRGVLRSARFIHNKLNELDILGPTLRDNPGYSLVLSGHSLGGSIATVLGLQLRRQFPDVRCYAYGPLAALSLTGIRTTYDFVFSIIAGDDVVPRLCVTSCEEIRTDIIRSLNESTTPKYKIISQAFVKFLFNKEIFKSAGKVAQANPFTPSDHTPDDSEKGYDSIDSECSKDSRLYPPGRILYLEKTPEGVRSLWKTGFHFQRIIVTPHLFRDHQPWMIQNLLRDVCEFEKSPQRRKKAQSFFLEKPSDSIDNHEVYSHPVNLADECIAL